MCILPAVGKIAWFSSNWMRCKASCSTFPCLFQDCSSMSPTNEVVARKSCDQLINWVESSLNINESNSNRPLKNETSSCFRLLYSFSATIRSVVDRWVCLVVFVFFFFLRCPHVLNYSLATLSCPYLSLIGLPYRSWTYFSTYNTHFRHWIS